MMCLPIKVDDSAMDLIVILRPETIRRLEQHDPAEIRRQTLGARFAALAIRNVVVTYASDADVATIMPMLENGDVEQAVQHLCRGWKYDPDAGDHDGPAESLRNLN